LSNLFHLLTSPLIATCPGDADKASRRTAVDDDEISFKGMFSVPQKSPSNKLLSDDEPSGRKDTKADDVAKWS
jgi:hypothetical protein